MHRSRKPISIYSRACNFAGDFQEEMIKPENTSQLIKLEANVKVEKITWCICINICERKIFGGDGIEFACTASKGARGKYCSYLESWEQRSESRLSLNSSRQLFSARLTFNQSSIRPSLALVALTFLQHDILTTCFYALSITSELTQLFHSINNNCISASILFPVKRFVLTKSASSHEVNNLATLPASAV